MGSVERMLLNFCTQQWDAEDVVTQLAPSCPSRSSWRSN